MLAVVLALLAWVGSSVPAAALSLLRDPDIEHGLRQLAYPILRAAGLHSSNMQVLVVNDSSLNAFVVDSRTIFVNYGLIQKVTKARQLQAVMAHEAAHIANGHIARRMGNFRSAQSVAAVGMILATIAAATGAGEAAAGIGLGVGNSALRSFLAHTRAEESSADQSAARYLKSAGISPIGLVELHQVFAGQELLSPGRQDPYARTHPFSRDRVRAAQAFVDAHGNSGADSPNTEYWFARVRGKLSAFTRAPKWTLRRAASEPYKDVRLMRQAIAHHRNHKFSQAIKSIDGAIALRPKDGYYYDLKGQILMENRQWGPAVAAYAAAVKLAPNEPLILGGLGRAQLAAGQTKTALKTLERARARDFRDPKVLRDLANAYAKTGQTGMAALTSAERYALTGRFESAAVQARRAVTMLPKGSVPARRAQDVLIASEKFEKRKKR
jgi:predicted Zn-dependent protease